MLKKLIFLAILLLQTSKSFAGQSVILASGEWEPFISKSYKGGGVINTIVTEAFKLQDIDIKYEYYPWKRAMRLVEHNKRVGSAGWVKTKERKGKVILSKEPIFYNATAFFHLKNLDFNWNGNVKKLKKFQLGTTLGYSYTNKLDKVFKSGYLKPDVALTDIIGLKKLLRKRTNLFLCDKDVCLTLARKYLTKSELELFKEYTYTVHIQSPLYLIMNNNQEKLMKEFNEGFKKLIKLGRYKKIITQFKKGKNYVN